MRLLLDLRCFLSFLSSCASQNVRERVISLVAGVFEHALIGRWPRVLAGPRPVPRVRVFYREAIQKSLVVHASEALDDVEVFRRPTEPGFIREISCVDDERIPSQWPTESPIQRRMFWGRCCAFMRTMRASWIISLRIMIESEVCTI